MRMLFGRRAFGALSLGTTIASVPSSSRAQQPRQRRAVLTVLGLVRNPEGVRLDLAALEALSRKSFTTATPWFREPVTFEGAPIADILRAAGAVTGERLVMSGLNDYSATMPMSDVEEFDPIVAYKRDGAYMGVEDKGPFFVAYDYDAAPASRRASLFPRSVWQVARLTVE